MGCGIAKSRIFKENPRANSFGIEGPETLKYQSPEAVYIKDKNYVTGKTYRFEEVKYNLKRPQLSTSRLL